MYGHLSVSPFAVNTISPGSLKGMSSNLVHYRLKKELILFWWSKVRVTMTMN